MATRWTSDTCGCQIDFYPNLVETDKVIHVQTLIACPKHAHLSGHQGHADAAWSMNQLKNRAQSFVAEKLGFPPEQHLHPVRGAYHPAAPFDKDPLLLIGHGKGGDDLSQMQADVDAQFGAGRVKLIPE